MNLQVIDGGKPLKRMIPDLEKDIIEITNKNLKTHTEISFLSVRKLRSLLKDYEIKDSVQYLDLACFVSQLHCAASYAAYLVIMDIEKDPNFNMNQNTINLVINKLISMKDDALKNIKG